jgi:ribosomal protein S28E/S33
MSDGSIVLMGGFGSAGQCNDVWRSTDMGATWTQMNASAGWSARNHHSSVVMPDGSIVLMGGGVYNDVWQSKDKGATWTEVNASAGWSPREGQSGVVMPDGSIVLMGGQGNGQLNDVWRSTNMGATWIQMTPHAEWSPRSFFSSVVMPDGSIVLMGGWNGGDKNDTWRSTDNGAHWTQMTPHAGWSARIDHSSVVMPDDSILIMGGGSTPFLLNDVWRSTDIGATWTQVTTNAAWLARIAHSSVVMPDGSIVMMGGQYSGGQSGYKNDVWRYQPAGSSSQNPIKTYTVPGIYNVSLQAYNSGGYSSTRKIGYITVNGPSPPTITITSPNGGETWQRGTTHTVTWDYTGDPGSTVKILRLQSGVQVGTITASTSTGNGGKGSYTWSILPIGSIGNDCKVFIQSISKPTIIDTSDNSFTLAPASTSPAITVTSPNGGETWQRGTTHTVTWDYTGDPGSYVKITRLQGGIEVGTISATASTGINGKGSYAWVISPTGTTGSYCQVKIQSISQPSVNDVSNNYFTLAPAGSTPPTITVTSPNGGEIWKRGTAKTVTWDYTGNPGTTVKITRLQGGVEVGTISASTSIGTGGHGSFVWSIGATGTTGTNCQVKIQSISQPTINDTSNNSFTLAPAGPTPPTITVTSPNGGETWKRGTTQTVTWDYTGNPGSYVKITRLQGGVEVGTISTSTSIGTGGHGSYVWNMGATGTTGTNCRVKIQSISQPTINDISNNNFTLSPATTPSISVTSPKGGESWMKGSNHLITWTSIDNTGSYIKIEILKSGVLVQTLSSSAPNNGTYNWTVNTGLTIGNDYRIRITSTTNTEIIDTSNSNFIIAPIPTTIELDGFGVNDEMNVFPLTIWHWAHWDDTNGWHPVPIPEQYTLMYSVDNTLWSLYPPELMPEGNPFYAQHGVYIFTQAPLPGYYKIIFSGDDVYGGCESPVMPQGVS